MKVFAPAVVRAPVVHDPPVEPEKLVHVPLAGEKVPLAGPLVILQVNFVVLPYRIMPGLAESVHVGEGGRVVVVVVVVVVLVVVVVVVLPPPAQSGSLTVIENPL